MSVDPSMLQGGGAPTDAPDPEGDETRTVTDELRSIIMTLGTLSQKAPEAGAEFKAAASALTAASIKLVSSQPQPGAGPPVVAA